MKLPALMLMICGIFALSAHAETCDVTPNKLIAKYQIKQSDHQGRTQSNRLDLYRFGQQIGHYFPQQGYGDWWTKNHNEQVMLTRYFPKYHKAIEYQAEDIKGKAIGRKSFWNQKQQLISTSLLSRMNVEQVTGQGCYQVEILSLREKGKKYQVRWLPRLRLVERFDVTKGSKVMASWRLKEIINDTSLIDTYVTNIQKYQTTDYADIGDNEQDPFLAKMIHQGFKPSTGIHHSNDEHKH